MTQGTPFRMVHESVDGRNKLLLGVNEIARAVSSTLGAAGKTVILENPVGGPYVTKDGVTVAEYVNPFDPVSNLGASLIREAARKTAADAGDGTTTSIVLAKAILDAALPKATASNFRSIMEGIDKGTKKVVKELNGRSTEVTTTNLIDIASISANNDKHIGQLIADAYDRVGIDGTVAIGESQTADTYVDVLDGSSINTGYASVHFANEADKCNLIKPHILILDQKLDNVWKIQEVLEGALKDGKSLLIIGQLEPGAIATLAMNVKKLGLKLCVVNPPFHGTQRQAILKDLADLTAANVVGEEYGNSIDTVSFNDLGTAKSVVVEGNRTIFKFDDTQDKVIAESIKDIKEELPNATGVDRGLLKYRLNLLTGKLAEIKVGAVTESAHKELHDRVDDAVHATHCALQEGIVPGGGVVLKDIAMKLHKDAKSEGEKALYEACFAPMRTIISNAGLDISNYPTINNRNKGLDVKSGKVVSTKSAGIIDPVKVTKNAIINAADVAKTILSTDIVVTNLRQTDVQ